MGMSCMQAAEFGVGALQEEGVWYFAFGANMTAKKLTDSRGIKPYEAMNGFFTRLAPRLQPQVWPPCICPSLQGLPFTYT